MCTFYVYWYDTTITKIHLSNLNYVPHVHIRFCKTTFLSYNYLYNFGNIVVVGISFSSTNKIPIDSVSQTSCEEKYSPS